MRINIRFKIKNITFFGMISKTQTLRGITSSVGKNQHMLFWDMENCTLEECSDELIRIQDKYELSGIYIFSDKDKSYRAVCFTTKPLKEYIHIITDTKYVDWNFIWWTTNRSEATLRFSDKVGRKPNKLVLYLPSKHKSNFKIPKNITKIKYDTGVDKVGVNILKVIK